MTGISDMDNWRNRLAARLCSWVLVHIADDSYERYIGGAIRYGMRAAARDELKARADGVDRSEGGKAATGD